MIASTPSAPYYAVIFTSLRTEGDHGYSETADLMEELSKKMEGYLGIESERAEIGITVSYWSSMESIKTWKQQTDHRIAQKKGREPFWRLQQCRFPVVIFM